MRLVSCIQSYKGHTHTHTCIQSYKGHTHTHTCIQSHKGDLLTLSHTAGTSFFGSKEVRGGPSAARQPSVAVYELWKGGGKGVLSGAILGLCLGEILRMGLGWGPGGARGVAAALQVYVGCMCVSQMC